MLHIILLILKVIGIVLLSILGILIAAILLVLFVPIRYRISAEKQDNIGADIKAGWLFRTIYFKAEYRNEKFIYFVKIFGFTIRTNLPPKKKKRKRKPSVKKAETKTTADKLHLTQIKTEQKKVLQAVQLEQKAPVPRAEQEAGRLPELLDNMVNNEEQREEREWFLLRWWKKVCNKIENIVSKLKSVWIAIKRFWSNLKEKIQSIIEFSKRICQKLNLIKEFLENETNKQGMKDGFTAIKKALRHIAPKKISGSIQFGTGDPCSTGQVLGVASLIYAYYGGSIAIIPDFENERIEGFLKVKGHIRIGTLLILGIRLIFNDNFKQLVNNFKQFKEEL